MADFYSDLKKNSRQYNRSLNSNDNPWYKGFDSNTTKGQILGIGSNIVSGMLQNKNPETQQWDINPTAADNALKTAANFIPGGGAIMAGLNIFNGIAGKVDEKNKYGAYKNTSIPSGVKDLAMGFQTVMNPFGSFEQNKEQNKRLGTDTFFLDFKKRRENEQKAGLGREAIANDMKSMQKQFETSQKKINNSANLFANSTRDANRIWGKNVLVAKNGIEVPEPISFNKHYEFKRKEYYNVKDNVITFKEGGSIIPMGAYHHTKNNLGDKGLPVVESNGVKIFEIERDELILDNDISREIKEEQYQYNLTGDKKHLTKIGSLMKKEILNNTHSPSPVYSCLNNGSCSVIN